MTIIAIDCDEVLIETVKGLSQYVKNTYGHDRMYHDYKHYFISENAHIDLDRDGAIMIFEEYYNSPHAINANPVPGAFEVLTNLKHEGYTLIVVTARNDNQISLTQQQIDKHFPNIFSDIHFAHHFTDKHKHKSELCYEIGATILVEDNIDYALEASEQGIKTYLLERPWNMRREETHPLMTKVKHWSEIEI